MKIRIPGRAITHHGVEPNEQLPHTSYERDLLGLAAGQELFVVRPKHGVVSYRHQHKDGSWRQFESSGLNLLVDDAVRGPHGLVHAVRRGTLARRGGRPA